MSCAGCDDCPQDAWHLHVTVKPHWSWSLDDVASALRRDIERHGIKPVVVTNHFHDPARKPYRELIPTKHMKGTEADAGREIFRMGVLLNNAGWRVKRLKIEADPNNDDVHRRALYFETHVKILPEHVVTARRLHFAISTTEKSTIATLRHPAIGAVNVRGRELLTETYRAFGTSPPAPLRIEAAVLDTNPDLDKEWMNQ